MRSTSSPGNRSHHAECGRSAATNAAVGRSVCRGAMHHVPLHYDRAVGMAQPVEGWNVLTGSEFGLYLLPVLASLLLRRGPSILSFTVGVIDYHAVSPGRSRIPNYRCPQPPRQAPCWRASENELPPGERLATPISRTSAFRITSPRCGRTRCARSGVWPWSSPPRPKLLELSPRQLCAAASASPCRPI